MDQQPNATQLSDDVLRTLVRAAEPSAPWPPRRVVHRGQFSNDFAEVVLPTGRSLVIKRGRFPWTRPRFQSSRMAATLIRESTRIVAPSPLPLPTELEPEPIEVYWRIDYPVLRELWPTLGASQRMSALGSLGRLLARLHEIELPGAGPLSDPMTPRRSLSDYLRYEVEERLSEAVGAVWPAAMATLTQLAGEIDGVEERAGSSGRLLHNDVHTGNVLCRVGGDGVTCVGIVDLETAIVGPPEADFASLTVHHGRLFNHPLEGKWGREVQAGYSAELDPWMIRFFRAYHLLNMGFYSALIGHDVHAADVAAAAAAEVAEL